jgi:hypothetical protein
MTTMVTTNSGGFWSEQLRCSTTKSDDRKAIGGFWGIYGKLPDSVLGGIFNYDDTYQKIMQEKVLVNIWKGRWQKFADKLECPYCKLAMDYLFLEWGFDEDGYHVESKWKRETYFPDEFRFVISNTSNFVKNMGISIKIYTSTPDCVDFEVFEGWVLNESEQKEAALISNRKLDKLKIENVHWNDENLYLWRQFYGNVW